MKSAKSPPKPKMTYAQATTKTLSKFAQNLVKPGYLAARAQLVVEPPEIPLNDEFLQAFGRSVTSSAPKKLPSSSTRISADVSSEDDYSESDGEEKTSPKPPQTPKEKPVRVRVSNLNFQTTPETLQKHFSKFGSVSNLQLLPSHIPSQQNSGRAYLTLGTMDAANRALDSRVSTVDGRTLRLEIVDDKPASLGRPSSQRSLLTTSPGRGLSMKCFNCQKTGHMAVNCPLPQATPTCTLCGTKHQSRCPLATECFRCYVPGHSAKECTRRFPLGKFCTLCTGTDHFRDSCREIGSSPKEHYKILESFSNEWEEKYDAGQRRTYFVNKNTGETSWTKPAVKKGKKNDIEKVICMVCFKEGHYCCNGSVGVTGNVKDMDFVLRVTIIDPSLSGVFGKIGDLNGACSNCGGAYGVHFAGECRRPKMEDINREGPREIEEVRERTKSKLI
ncbi:hypothetical protein TrLO_g2662 [Triparma laevis f. longispina]|uniref:Uncharacterized protein n=1 Tax=Triparma laevis f. longispina TaxID=1714387 RepID=A0A9W7ATL3_9STRA|nr:hypothetical protein TrLO_g2662 [Triparma laevis f. longispina]